ncbi:MAG: hypothetical protein HYR63_12395 [Proteobacteria bacterium]|nr:hypothetical protein [Pseudomonadota bacterium]MBI3499097.1 hypothetical protein [Pseudomonadota bacterium]
MRQPFWRPVVSVSSLLLALSWSIGAGYWTVQRWPLRDNLMRLELSRSESECGLRPGGPANVERCKDLVRISHRAVEGSWMLQDGLIVFGPMLLGVWIAFAVRRGGHDREPRAPREHRNRVA